MTYLAGRDNTNPELHFALGPGRRVCADSASFFAHKRYQGPN